MFDVEAFVREAMNGLRDSIPGRAIIACSGGVDSTAAAVLASRAIGERLLAVYVDTGMMRKGETENVSCLLKRLGVNFKVIDASDEFFLALKGVTDPERKRKIIGEKFIRIFERTARDF
ncbi:MAG: 7-cyano-7-deazaguanine synthase, partial [Methanomassiliicoccales archaeon]|nr:7-cyano-7-deazaguanine synthase [Methanomassiliicoccales archaeon]